MQSTPPFSASRAYLIGIANYHFPDWQLKTPLQDTRSLQTLLQEKHGFSVTTVSDPTANELCRLFEKIRQESTSENARILIYYAGHGIQRDSAYGLKGYFVPADGRPGDEKSMVPMELLSETLRNVKSRHVLLILDCCFAGTFRMLNRREIMNYAGKDQTLFRQHYDIFTRFPSRLVLSSTSYRQKAFDRIEDADVNSPFNRFLCEAIEGAADYTRDRLVTASELKTYLTDHVSQITGYAGNLQSVSIDTLEGDGEGEYLFFLDGFSASQLPEKAYINPYKGLQSYETGDASLFFGRQKAARTLQDKLKQNPFVIVAGASGTGKSSLVKAGLLPALIREGLPENRISVIRPGKNPVNALTPQQQWDLLVVDQWEELITQTSDPKESQRFYAEIRRLLDHGKRIVGTVRADFEAQARQDILEPYWTRGRFVVPSFSSEEYHDIIVQPAKRVACLFEDRELIGQIEQEVAQQPGPLPLLSFMLSELFEQAKSESGRYREIKRRHYESIGGVSGALRNKAEAVYAALPDEAHRDSMRRIMLRMVALSAGEMAGRRVFLSEIEYRENAENHRLGLVVQNLDESKLIRRDADDAGQPFLEPAHDALVRAWKRLWDWVRDLGEENLLLHAKLMTAVSDYKSNAGTKKFLWTSDPRLEQSRALMQMDPLLLNATERTFVTSSLEEKSRRTRNTRIIVTAVILGLATLAGAAWWQRGVAQQQQVLAEKRLKDFLNADSTRLAEEAAKERLNFDKYVREGDTYMTSFDYDLAYALYQKADSLYRRFSNDPDLIQKIAPLRAKIAKVSNPNGHNGRSEYPEIDNSAPIR